MEPGIFCRAFLAQFAPGRGLNVHHALLCLSNGLLDRDSPPYRAVAADIGSVAFLDARLLRIYSVIGLMRAMGPLTSCCNLLVSLTSHWLQGSDFAIVRMHCLLPLMILPLYAALTRMDHTLHRLHLTWCDGFTVFRTVTLPLSAGVIAGCILMFVPAFGEYMVPTLLGSPELVMAPDLDVYAGKVLPGHRR